MTDSVDISLCLGDKQPRDIFVEKLQRLVAADCADKFLVMPNFAEESMRAPTGFVMCVEKNKPFKMDALCSDLFSGTSIAKINNFDESKFYVNHLKNIALFEKINAQTSNKSCSALPDLKAKKDSSDTNQWFFFRGINDSYVGIYHATVLNFKTKAYERQYFIACYDGLPQKIQVEIEAHLILLEKNGSTFDDVARDEVLARARALSKRNRQRKIFTVADLLGLEILHNNDVLACSGSDDGVEHDEDGDDTSSDNDEDSCDDFKTPQLASLMFNCEQNFFKTHKNRFLFYSNCSSVTECKGNVIVNRSLTKGPIVIYGPEKSTACSRSSMEWGKNSTNSNLNSSVFLSEYLKKQNAAGLEECQHTKFVNIPKERLCQSSIDDNEEILRIETKLGRNHQEFPRIAEFLPILITF